VLGGKQQYLLLKLRNKPLKWQQISKVEVSTLTLTLPNCAYAALPVPIPLASVAYPSLFDLRQEAGRIRRAAKPTFS